MIDERVSWRNAGATKTENDAVLHSSEWYIMTLLTDEAKGLPRIAPRLQYALIGDGSASAYYIGLCQSMLAKRIEPRSDWFWHDAASSRFRPPPETGRYCRQQLFATEAQVYTEESARRSMGTGRVGEGDSRFHWPAQCATATIDDGFLHHATPIPITLQVLQSSVFLYG